jgi:hypothetical protein
LGRAVERKVFQVAPKIKAEDNPWYLLATLYGVPNPGDDELTSKNRQWWNRYFASGLHDETRTKLIEEKRYAEHELTPLSPAEMEMVEKAFAERCKLLARTLTLPPSTDDINFSDVEFERHASFTRYVFSRRSSFRSAIFSGRADFDGATFFGAASFQGAKFFGEVIFYGAKFSPDVDFGKAIFSSGSSFVNTEMKGETCFNDAVFKTEPPRFFDAKLHQGTVWRGITWPSKPEDKDEAGRFIDAYACLKLEMDRLKKHEDELDFFALELQSRRVMLGTWKGLPVAIYGVLSDYGRSYLRPLVALFYLALVLLAKNRRFSSRFSSATSIPRH